MLYAVRTTIGQEKTVSDSLRTKQKKQGNEIYSIIYLDSFRGYLLVEAESEEEVKKISYGVPHLKGIVSGTVDPKDVEKFLEQKPLIEGVNRGDIVEITNGAFKGEKAKVIRIDENKEKVTVEIIEAAVPIPITVNASAVRKVALQGDQ